MQESNGQEHDVGGVEVGTGEDDRNETDGEEAGGNSADEAWRVFLVPWRRVGAEGDGTSDGCSIISPTYRGSLKARTQTLKEVLP